MKKLYYSAAICLIIAFLFHLVELKNVSKVFIIAAGVLFIVKYVYDKINNRNDNDNTNGQQNSKPGEFTRRYYKGKNSGQNGWRF